MTRARQRLKELLTLGRRPQQVLVLSVITGALTGAAVALFDWIVSDVIFARVLRQSDWFKAVAPAIGLILAALALKFLAKGATPATSDEYIRNFHDRERRLDERPVLGRIAASIATLGLEVRTVRARGYLLQALEPNGVS